jgi:hypothetical protein
VAQRKPESVTSIHPSIPRLAASVVPVIVAIMLSVGGLSLGELTLLWGGIVLLLLAVSAVLSYMLWNGQFPPRISTQGSDLPGEDVKETAAALELLEASLRDITGRVQRMESRVGIEGGEK